MILTICTGNYRLFNFLTICQNIQQKSFIKLKIQHFYDKMSSKILFNLYTFYHLMLRSLAFSPTKNLYEIQILYNKVFLKHGPLNLFKQRRLYDNYISGMKKAKNETNMIKRK